MKRVAFIVKYFPASERISGLTSLASLLFGRLHLKLDLHVFSQCSQEHAQQWSKKSEYMVHAVNGNYWLCVGRAVKNIDPACIVIMSGIHVARLIYPTYRPLIAILGDNAPIYFYQGVNMDVPPGRMGCLLLTRLNHIICTSPRLMSIFSSRFSDHCTYLSPGIDLDSIRSTPSAARGTKFRVGYFNHFNKVKGCDIALEAFASNPLEDTEYIVAGVGPMEEELRSRFNRHDSIKFLGYLPDPISEIKACDIVVFPFRKAVGVLGICQTALECLAAGVPVISSDNDAITPAVRHEKEGLIFNKSEQLGECIRRIHDDPALQARLASKASQRAEQYRIETIADKFYALLQKDTL